MTPSPIFTILSSIFGLIFTRNFFDCTSFWWTGGIFNLVNCFPGKGHAFRQRILNITVLLFSINIGKNMQIFRKSMSKYSPIRQLICNKICLYNCKLVNHFTAFEIFLSWKNFHLNLLTNSINIQSMDKMSKSWLKTSA
jgi:hypothetical protein